MADNPNNKLLNLTDEEEIRRLNGPYQFFGVLAVPEPIREHLSDKYEHKPRAQDRKHPWFRAEYDEMQAHITAFRFAHINSHRFRIYWLAKRYECSEEKVLERIAATYNHCGYRFTAYVYRFGTGHPFTWLIRTGKRRYTKLTYARGMDILIRKPPNWSPKAGMTRQEVTPPKDWPQLKRKHQVEVPLFRDFVSQRAGRAFARDPSIRADADGYWTSKEPEGEDMTKLWGAMIGKILEADITEVATNLVPVDVKKSICRLILLEIEGLVKSGS